jgi:mRNA-degrading endonuclease RelE of RelBE toxin-antitoxin system
VVQDPSQNNVDNLNKVRRKASSLSRSKREYLKAKIEELGTNSKIKYIWYLYRSINDLRRVAILELI